MDFEHYPETPFTFLTRADVIAAADSVDLVETVADALRLHADGATELPAEAYLGWTTPAGSTARLLAMPGALLPGAPASGAPAAGVLPSGSARQGADQQGVTRREAMPVVGLKTINAAVDNPDRGIPRSQGFTLLLDPHTARPRALMEAAWISAMRTAAVTALAVRELGVPGPRSLALLGCGALARAHARLLLESFPTLDRVHLHDTAPDRAAKLAAELNAEHPDRLTAVAVSDPRACVAQADVVVPVTTVTEGYLEPEWLRPGALVAHVSLDDLSERAVLRADLLVVDDWGLVADDPRRLLGRMHRAGALLGPDGRPRPGVTAQPHARAVDGTLGDVLTGRIPGRRAETDVVVSNPFGMAVLDVAVAEQIRVAAEKAGLGQRLAL